MNESNKENTKGVEQNQQIKKQKNTSKKQTGNNKQEVLTNIYWL